MTPENIHTSGISKEQEAIDASTAQFIQKGMLDQSIAMARHSTGETWGTPTPRDEKDTKIILKAISAVPVVDEHIKEELAKIDPNNLDEEGITLVAEVTMAKAGTLGREQKREGLWNKIIEKVGKVASEALVDSKKKRALVTTGAMALILAACSVVKPTEPSVSATIMPSSTPESTLVYTPTKEVTKTPTNTPTQTQTSTPEATATKEVMKLNTDPENIEAYTRITMEDITSGRFAEANRAIAKPFPKEATYFPTIWSDVPGVDMVGRDYPPGTNIDYKNNPNMRPQKWLSFSKIEIDGKDYVVAGLQILNKDRTYGILPILITPEVIKEGIETFKGEYYASVIVSFKSKPLEKWGELLQIAYKLYSSGKQSELCRKWVAENHIDKEMEENIFIVSYNIDW
jgi:hypothetical protein